MEQRNLAVELLQKLLKGEVASRRRKNVVQARSFAEMLEEAVRRYQNRAVEAAQVIEELIELAREMRAANARGEELGLTMRSWRSTTRWRPMTAPSRYSRRNPVRDCPRTCRNGARATSPSTGRSARTCAPTSGGWSSASFTSMAIRRTSRRRRRGLCWNRRKRCRVSGPCSVQSRRLERHSPDCIRNEVNELDHRVFIGIIVDADDVDIDRLDVELDEVMCRESDDESTVKTWRAGRASRSRLVVHARRRESSYTRAGPSARTRWPSVIERARLAGDNGAGSPSPRRDRPDERRQKRGKSRALLQSSTEALT